MHPGPCSIKRSKSAKWVLPAKAEGLIRRISITGFVEKAVRQPVAVIRTRKSTKIVSCLTKRTVPYFKQDEMCIKIPLWRFRGTTFSFNIFVSEKNRPTFYSNHLLIPTLEGLGESAIVEIEKNLAYLSINDLDLYATFKRKTFVR